MQRVSQDLHTRTSYEDPRRASIQATHTFSRSQCFSPRLDGETTQISPRSTGIETDRKDQDARARKDLLHTAAGLLAGLLPYAKILWRSGWHCVF